MTHERSRRLLTARPAQEQAERRLLRLRNAGGRRSYGHTGSMPGFIGVMRIDAGPGLTHLHPAPVR